jgi:NADH pyrophosphatase NudC (nudix superfamily)
MKYCPKCGQTLCEGEVNGERRLRCASMECDYVFWDNPTPVVAVVVEWQGDLILVRPPHWPPKWQGLVTGFLERGETPEQGVLREVREELGQDGELLSFIGHYAFEQRNQLIMAYHVRIHGEPVLGAELESYKRLPPEQVRPWALGTGPALRDWLRARGFFRDD